MKSNLKIKFFIEYSISLNLLSAMVVGNNIYCLIKSIKEILLMKPKKNIISRKTKEDLINNFIKSYFLLIKI